MKIESTSNTSLASLQNGTQRASQSDAKEAVGNVQQAGSTKNSTVSRSPLASDLHAANGSDIDTAKVESIKVLSTARDLLQSRTFPTGG